MKLSFALTLSAISGAAAFAPTSTIARPSTVFMSDASVDEEMVENVMAIEEPVEELPTKSMALPFMDRPAALTGALAGGTFLYILKGGDNNKIIKISS